ncbi:Aste57867_12602 [Aphanomyces stellatus]|uniref:Aste57867_12602 protein n=1 Tax=Aphanomyces stellatus TaxID=120398 RepID=A0A485KW10_9STRA|nr:hypothetical protein As57867_012556 [Aphanomyces stellatus]VFT89453.1 Aste57867_12602 [Aphanomyces stellatus]
MSIKSGTLFKKGSGHGLVFKRYNWVPRHVTLTTDSLNYYDHQGGHIKGSIDLSDCTVASLEMLPADCTDTGKGLSTGWRIAIETPHGRYFLAALSEREMVEWMDALVSVVSQKHVLCQPTLSHRRRCFLPMVTQNGVSLLARV